MRIGFATMALVGFLAMGGVSSAKEPAPDLRERSQRPRSTDVLTQYTQVTAAAEVDPVNAKRRFVSLPDAMKTALWTLHLQRAFLDQHDLTPEQRAVLLESLAFMSGGAAEVDRRAADWQDRVGEPAREIGERAKALFPLEDFRAIFAFGMAPPCKGEEKGADSSPQSEKYGGDCSCDSSCSMNFCSTPTEPYTKCESGGAMGCTPTVCCCCWFWLYGCDGTCV